MLDDCLWGIRATPWRPHCPEIAGASGDRNARIYCLAFGAELVSIAGIFRVFEAIPADLIGKSVQIWLDGDKLRFDILN